MIILSIVGLSVTMNTMGSLQYAKFTEANHVASSLAISKMEELAAIDAADLDSSDNLTESSVSWPGFNFTFTRTTTITINSDSSRTVDIVVASNDAPLPTTVNFSTTFALWE